MGSNKIVSLDEARTLGLKRYFTGKPCKHGHVAERFVLSSKCTECDKKNGPLYYKANLEINRERRRAYRDANREKIREMCRKYRKENLEKELARSRRYYSANREMALKRINAWDRNNPIKKAVASAARRARIAQATPSWADQEMISWFYQIAADETQRTGERHEVDHIIPLRGKTVCGLHVEANMQILTKSENSRKKNKYRQDQALAPEIEADGFVTVHPTWVEEYAR